MIKHHPNDDLLNNFVDGQLPASLSAAIAIHADMCVCCQQKIAKLTAQQADISFQQAHLHDFIIGQNEEVNPLDTINLDSMIDEIVSDDAIAVIPEQKSKTISIGDSKFTLPATIANIELGQFSHIGKLSRARFQLDEEPVRSSLLNIRAGGSVPEHTHNGYEVTVLLSGEFSDELGDYVPGDFIVLDGKTTHHPFSEHGCLCFAVVSDSLHFTQGINKLLNPIGNLIY